MCASCCLHLSRKRPSVLVWFQFKLCSVAQSCPTPCDPMACSPPGCSAPGILQARILEWVAISSSRGSSLPRDRTQVSCVSCIAGGFFLTKATWEASSEQGTQIRRPPAPQIQLGSVASDSPVSCPFTPAGPHGLQCPLCWFPRTWRLGLRKSSAWLLCSWYKSLFLLYSHSGTLWGSARVFFFFFFPQSGEKEKRFLSQFLGSLTVRMKIFMKS